MRMCHVCDQNGPLALSKPLILVSSTYPPFLLYKILKKFLQWTQSCKDAPFLGPKCLFAPNKTLFEKFANIIFIYLLAPFTVQNVKKILSADPEL